MSEKGFGSCGCHQKVADNVERIDQSISYSGPWEHAKELWRKGRKESGL